MARPRKMRLVCKLPDNGMYGPVRGRQAEELEKIDMTVVEYEVIRLMDYEGLQQQACADMMNVARSTVQRIYESARKKLAQSIVEGKAIKIEGGNFKLCNHDQCERERRHCQRHQQNEV